MMAEAGQKTAGETPRGAFLASRFLVLGTGATLLSVPLAVPAVADMVQKAAGWQVAHYLTRPVENQTAALSVGLVATLVPWAVWRALGPVGLGGRAGVLSPGGAALRSGLFWTLAALGAAMLTSALLAAQPGLALATLAPMLLALVAGLAMATVSVADHAPTRALAVAVAVSLPVSFYAIMQNQGIELLPYAATTDAKQRVGSTFGHPNYLGSWLAPVVFCAGAFALGAAGRARAGAGFAVLALRVGAWLAVAAALATLLTGGTRGALLAIGAGAVAAYAVLAAAPRYRRALLFMAGLGAVLATLILVIPNPLVNLQFQVSDRLFASGEISSRFYFWMVATEIVKDNMLLGVGAGHFNLMFWDAANALQMRPGAQYYDFILNESIRGEYIGFTHNDYLQMAAEGGVVALGLFFAAISIFACQTISRKVAQAAGATGVLWRAALVGGVVAMLVDALFNFPLHIPASAQVFFLLLGLWIGQTSQFRAAGLRGAAGMQL